MRKTLTILWKQMFLWLNPHLERFTPSTKLNPHLYSSKFPTPTYTEGSELQPPPLLTHTHTHTHTRVGGRNSGVYLLICNFIFLLAIFQRKHYVLEECDMCPHLCHMWVWETEQASTRISLSLIIFLNFDVSVESSITYNFGWQKREGAFHPRLFRV